jgi:alpha-tubulin suppressor-like RCC1 family protein
MACWGLDDWGQLAYATPDGGLGPPLPVAGLAAQVRMMAAGGDHTCAALVTGGMQCWGHNDRLQLGVADAGAFLSSPMAVTSLSGIADIAAGVVHTCATVADGGTVECWGDGAEGELGIPNAGTTSTPALVPGVAGVVAIAAGQEHTCVITDGGAVTCWGQNQFAQLGNGTLTYGSSTAAPTSVLQLVGATAVAGGGAHTCAVVGDGGVACWGSNSNGQLGTGAPTEVNYPVVVP